MTLWISKAATLRSLTLSAEVVAKSPLLVGESGDPFMTPYQVVVMRNANGSPIIPGSSWKGVFRSAGERICASLGIRTCRATAGKTCLDGADKDIADLSKDRKALLEFLWKKSCINCKVYGAPHLSSSVTIYDSVGIAGNYSFGGRTTIMVDRMSGAVMDRMIVKTEYVEPGSAFNFLLRAVNLPNYAIGYLIQTMDYLNQGFFSVGRNKSRGFGQVGFQKLRLSLEGVTIEKGEFKALDEFDSEVKATLPSGELSAESFFKAMAPFEEVFARAKIEYPMLRSGRLDEEERAAPCDQDRAKADRRFRLPSLLGR